MVQVRLNWCMTLALHVHKMKKDAISIPMIAIRRNNESGNTCDTFVARLINYNDKILI